MPGDLRAAPRELEAVKTGVAADIERAPAGEVSGNVPGNFAPFKRREIAEIMLRRGLRAVGQVKVVEPRAELGNFLFERRRHRAGTCCAFEDVTLQLRRAMRRGVLREHACTSALGYTQRAPR